MAGEGEFAEARGEFVVAHPAHRSGLVDFLGIHQHGDDVVARIGPAIPDQAEIDIVQRLMRLHDLGQAVLGDLAKRVWQNVVIGHPRGPDTRRQALAALEEVGLSRAAVLDLRDGVSRDANVDELEQGYRRSSLDARELVLSTATVKTHLQHLYEKLGATRLGDWVTHRLEVDGMRSLAAGT